MIGATKPVAQIDALLRGRDSDRPAGKNCWRVDRAQRFYCVQDAADYFRLVRQAMLGARQTVFILGWDIRAKLDLLPARNAGPTRRPGSTSCSRSSSGAARSFVATSSSGTTRALYTLERDPFSRWRLGWRMPRGVRFGFDDRHPVGASHHQKIVVVDDQLAFCGGIDLTGHRWDTSAHRRRGAGAAERRPASRTGRITKCRPW